MSHKNRCVYMYISYIDNMYVPCIHIYIYIYIHIYILIIHIFMPNVFYISAKKKGCFDQIKTLFVKSQQAGLLPLRVIACKAVEAAWPSPSLPSWWLNHQPTWKICKCRQIGSSPQVNIKKYAETTTTFTNLPFGICAIYLNLHIATGKGKGSTPKDRGRDGYKKWKLQTLTNGHLLYT